MNTQLPPSETELINRMLERVRRESEKEIRDRGLDMYFEYDAVLETLYNYIFSLPGVRIQTATLECSRENHKKWIVFLQIYDGILPDKDNMTHFYNVAKNLFVLWSQRGAPRDREALEGIVADIVLTEQLCA